MKDKLTKKQKGFANDYLDSGNGTQSALKNYKADNVNSAAAIASQNLRKLKVQEYIADKAQDAASMIYILSQKAKAEAIRLNASKDILDRGGHKPVEQTDITSKGEKIIIMPAELMKKNDTPRSTK